MQSHYLKHQKRKNVARNWKANGGAGRVWVSQPTQKEKMLQQEKNEHMRIISCSSLF
jgi:hypothetical protein